MNSRLAAFALTAALVPAIANAELRFGNDPSTMSALSGVIVVIGSVYVLTSPSILINNLMEDSNKPGHMRTEVVTDKGTTQTILLPKEVVEKNKLQKGDKLTVKPMKAGALVSKDDKPVVYIVSPENAKLSRSSELAR